MKDQTPILKESASQTAGPYVHIGLTPNHAGITGVYAQDLGSGTIAADMPGERITIRGKVFDGGGAPLKDALIEIWQADADGIYHAPNDRRWDGKTEFGWGRTATDGDTGAYEFHTVKPGAVAWPGGGWQAPHISFWIVARGINLGLNTRLYFAEDKQMLAADPLLKRVEPDRWKTIVIARTGDAYEFNIHLQGPDETVFFDI